MRTWNWNLVLIALITCPIAASATESIEIVSTDGFRIYGEVYEAKHPRAVILLFHQGGGSSLGEYAPIAPRLVEAGYTAVAVDLRAGGNVFKVSNRTAAQLDAEAHYCEAWPDIVATLEYAKKRYPTAKLIAWGSSYSAALVMRLAAERGDELSGILSFSPADGDAMGECGASRFASSVKIPALALRPKREAEMDSVKAQLKSLDALGIETYVADPGVHGSSMLVDERSGGSTENTWNVVLAFLEEASFGVDDR